MQPCNKVYTTQEYQEMVRYYYLAGRNSTEATRLYAKHAKIKGRRVPNSSTIYEAVCRFRENGTFTPNVVYSAAQSNDKLRDKVVNFVRANPIQNISAIGRRFGIHRHTVSKWLVQEGLIYKEERKRGRETEKESKSKRKKKDADNNKCCCCLTEAGDRNLWSSAKKSGDDHVYGRLLQQCFDITFGNQNIKEGHKICNNCKLQLKQALQFKQQVLECQQKIKKSICELKDTLASKSESELPDLYENKAGISADLEGNSYNQYENVENQLELEPEPDLVLKCEPELETEPEAELKLVLEVDVNEEASVKFEPDDDDDEIDDEHLAIQEAEVKAELLPEEGPDPLDGVNEEGPDPLDGIKVKPEVYLEPKKEIECVNSTMDDSDINYTNTLQDCLEIDTNTGQESAVAIHNCTQREMLIHPSNIVQDFNKIGQRLPVPQAESQLRTYKPKRPAAVRMRVMEEVSKPNTSRELSKVKKVVSNYLRKKERKKVIQQSLNEILPVPEVMQRSFKPNSQRLRVYKPKRPAAVKEIDEVPKPNTSKERS